MTDAPVGMRSLVVERVMPHPQEKIWRALTQGALLEEWLMKNDFQPVVGHKFNLRSNPMPHWNGVVDCEVLIVEPNERGYATAILAGLNRSVFQGSGEPLPPSFAIYPTFVAHVFFALLLAGFVVLHVLAALYHQFFRKTVCSGGCGSGDVLWMLRLL